MSRAGKAPFMGGTMRPASTTQLNIAYRFRSRSEVVAVTDDPQWGPYARETIPTDTGDEIVRTWRYEDALIQAAAWESVAAQLRAAMVPVREVVA